MSRLRTLSANGPPAPSRMRTGWRTLGSDADGCLLGGSTADRRHELSRSAADVEAAWRRGFLGGVGSIGGGCARPIGPMRPPCIGCGLNGALPLLGFCMAKVDEGCLLEADPRVGDDEGTGVLVLALGAGTGFHADAFDASGAGLASAAAEASFFGDEPSAGNASSFFKLSASIALRVASASSSSSSSLSQLRPERSSARLTLRFSFFC